VILPNEFTINYSLIKGVRVLVVSEVCAGRYGAGRVGKGSARGEERLVGRSTAGAAVGVAEENPLRPPVEWI